MFYIFDCETNIDQPYYPVAIEHPAEREEDITLGDLWVLKHATDWKRYKRGFSIEFVPSECYSVDGELYEDDSSPSGWSFTVADGGPFANETCEAYPITLFTETRYDF